jgi:hypothetical protein
MSNIVFLGVYPILSMEEQLREMLDFSNDVLLSYYFMLLFVA